MKRLLSWYAWLASKPPLAALNDALLKGSLRARGYNNCCDPRATGEEFFVREVLAKSAPTVCIDVGANVGHYSELLLLGTKSHVISFEPLPQPFEQLRSRMRAYGDRSVVVNKGVGETTCRRVMHYNAAASVHASFSVEVSRVPFVKNHESLVVDMVTLDDYLQGSRHEEVSFIKIDTEGYEGEVLKGAASSVRRYCPRFIQIEFNRHQLFRDRSLLWFADQLPQHDVYQLIPNGWVRRDPTDPLANVFEYSNFVFVRRV